MADIVVLGTRGLDRKLRSITANAPKSVSRAAMAGSVAPLKKQIRKQVNALSISPELKRASRKTIGSSVKKQPGGMYGAKAGFGVGKQTKRKRMDAAARASSSSRAGVGLSSVNIHWFVLGTGERYTSSGKYTGSIADELSGIVPVAVAAARGQMISEAARRAAVAFKREAKKRR